MNASHRGYCDYVSIRYDANAGAIITDTTAWTEVATTKISYFMTGVGGEREDGFEYDTLLAA